jgi:hypothetical protein
MIVSYKNKIFEYVFNRVLNKNIRRNFTPNNYNTFYTETELNQFGKKNELYFTNKETEVNNNVWDNELIADYENDKRAIDLYTGYIGAKINTFFRNSEESNFLYWNETNTLSKIINKFETESNVIGIRRLPRFVLDKAKKGSTCKEKGFLGCSLKLDYRFKEETGSTELNNEALLIIKIPKGTNAFYAESISKRKEFELIIQKGIQIKIEKNIRVFNNRIVIGEII